MKMRHLCAVVLCLTMLCSCGVQPPQQSEVASQEAIEEAIQEASQEASREAEDQPAVFNIYDLPLFDNLPKDYSTADPAFWAAESPNGGKVYILGSIHVANETVYRLPKHIMDAYLESDALAVEMDIVVYDSDETAQKSDEERTTYADGDSLRSHIDPLMFEQLQEYISNNTDDPQLLSSLENRKPAIWLSVLEEIEDDAAGLSQEFGIDRHFLQIAHAQGKEIIEIETSASQYDALNRIPDKAYEFLFSAYIFQTAETAADSARDTYDTWKSGTLPGSIEMIDDEAADADTSGYAAALSDYYRIIFTERNAAMADAAQSYLDDGKKVFFIVGAEHLLGSSGVIARLEAEGYDITQLGGE